MNLIEELGGEKCQAIVDGAPEGTTLFFCFGKEFERRVDYYKHFFNYFQMWLPDHGWFPVHSDMAEDTMSLDNLRSAIADHNRTDYVSDIHNHISPLTKEIER